MKAYELMYLAAKNPEKYEGKTFKLARGHAMSNVGTFYNENDVVSVEKGKVYINSCNELNISQHTELTEIQQEVPFMEAVKAYAEGKTIRCELEGETHTYEPNEYAEAPESGYCLHEKYNEEAWITTREVLEGTWFIEND